MDRYAYVNNNPLKYTDPSGHCVVGGHEMPDEVPACQWTSSRGNAPVLNLTPTPDPEPWKNYPGYDPGTNSIPLWGDNMANEAWRLRRAELVWEWICTSGGWWGSGCPEAKDLAAWLLMMEGGSLYNNFTTDRLKWEGIKVMVALFQYLFDDANGITPQDLSRFTAFFNPQQGDGGVFGASDWNKLQTKPDQLYFDEVNRLWDRGPYFIDDRMVDRWWTDKEKIQCTNCVTVFSFDVPIEGTRIYFGYLP